MKIIENEEGILTRFLAITRKPFTLLDFVTATGIQKTKALFMLQKAEGEKAIGMIQKGEELDFMTFIVYPQKVVKEKRFDFKPKREKLQMILEKMGEKELYKEEIKREVELSEGTFDRYLKTLVVLGCIDKKTEGVKSRFIKTGKELPAEIPYFYREVRRQK